MSGAYEKLLNRALTKVPKRTTTGERFELPTPTSAMVGSKTIIFNFSEICDKLNRDRHHVMKFLSKEMATAGSTDGARAIFQGRFNRESIARLIQIYTNRYVVCPICRRPDTKIAKEGRFSFLVCDACGAKSSVLPT